MLLLVVCDFYIRGNKRGFGDCIFYGFIVKFFYRVMRVFGMGFNF